MIEIKEHYKSEFGITQRKMKFHLLIMTLSGLGATLAFFLQAYMAFILLLIVVVININTFFFELIKYKYYKELVEIFD